MKNSFSLPSAAETYLDELLYEASEGDAGLSDRLEKYKQQVKEFYRKRQGPVLSDEELERYMQATKSRLMLIVKRGIYENVERIKRLKSDQRMRQAYIHLSEALTQDQQWRDFLSAALRACENYNQNREESDKTAKLSKQIASTAEKLSALIGQFQGLILEDSPRELFRIQHLLGITDNNEIFGSKFEKWQQLKPTILGDSYAKGLDSTEERTPTSSPYRQMIYKGKLDTFFKVFQDVAGDFDESLGEFQLAWNMAPRLPALLDTLSTQISQYKPKHTGVIGAVTNASNKRTIKTQYIRGLAYLLTNEYEIPLTLPLQKAISIITNVILNDPEIDATDDDVRKALEKLSK